MVTIVSRHQGHRGHRGHHRHHFFSIPGGGRPFHRGDFKYIILKHISEKPSYGYEIIRALKEKFHSFYSPSPGSVYPTLQMLEEMGYTVAAEKDGKKVYTITKEGREFLAERKDSDELIKDRIERWWNPENCDEVSETMSEFEKLAMLVRDKARNADPEQLAHMHKVISRAHDEISGDED